MKENLPDYVAKHAPLLLRRGGWGVRLLLFLLLSACGKPGNNFSNIGQQANIYPPYRGTVIPCNIAPLNFMIREEGSRFTVRFAVAGKDSFDVSCRGKVLIPLQKWKKMLEKHRGEQMSVRIFAKGASGWVCYSPLRFTIAPEPVDPYLAYRLIEPGYEVWGEMGIYQRCLENFDETPVMVNSLTDRNCMNCHSFCRHSPQTMLFHMRQQHAGTLFVKDGKISKVNTRAPGMLSAGVYPRWHPGGRYVAFSANTTRQEFHTAFTNKVEVYDQASDIVVFDIQTNTIFTDSLIYSGKYFETFPEWSPDGRYLYFCSAAARPMPQEYDSLRYDLLRIAFDASASRFGRQIDTLVSSARTGKSVALARVSPDGKYVVFCMSNYGTFPIWHRENDLYILNLETKEIRNLSEINSDQSDSYHSWSTNGRWMVFGSRRADGAFTRPYICYFDTNGNVYTPFLLPQKDPMYYDFSTKSYNIPEFISGKVDVSPYEFTEAAKGKAIELNSGN
ncbi:MAG: hypothetical protein LBL04_11000 [Bacteroidales bacterium]|jgi:hypothetical protein|nr:hypothetical protein [Bacteroidales bacterium]